GRDGNGRPPPNPSIGKPLVAPLASPEQAPGDETEKHQSQDGNSDPARVRRDAFPGLAREVPEEDETRRPRDPPKDVVEGELSVRHLRHPSEARHQHAERRGEPPDEHRCSSAAPDERPRTPEMLVDPVPDQRHASPRASQDPMSPTTADGVPIESPRI